jgi:hypothetical protein
MREIGDGYFITDRKDSEVFVETAVHGPRRQGPSPADFRSFSLTWTISVARG